MSMENKKILVVEDVDAARRSLKLILGRNGYTVISAANGAEALLYCKDDDLSDRFDLVITVLEMPEMGGFELIKRLGQMSTPPPVVVVSGYNDKKNVLEAFRNRICFDFLDKPLSEAVILDGVRNALDKYEREQLNSGTISRGCVNELLDGLETPLCEILGFSSVLEESASGDPEDLKAYMEGIKSAAGMIKDGLSCIQLMNAIGSELNGTEVKVYDLRNVLDSAFEKAVEKFYFRSSLLKVDYEEIGAECNFRGCGTLLSEAVYRLLETASQCAGEKKAAIRCRLDRKKGVDGILSLTIAFDAKQEIQEKIHNCLREGIAKFRIYRDAGMGGLAVCRMIIDRLGGSVNIYGSTNEPGGAFVFHVQVPLELC